MSGTFTQIYIQIVFAVKYRENLIQPQWKDRLQSYRGGLIANKGQKPIIINSMPDHTHVFVGMKPIMNLSDLVRDIKNNSSKFINENKLVRGTFRWQESFYNSVTPSGFNKIDLYGNDFLA